MWRQIRSWLHAPGNNSKSLERVFTAGTDAVILDLEAAIPPGRSFVRTESVEQWHSGPTTVGLHCSRDFQLF